MRVPLPIRHEIENSRLPVRVGLQRDHGRAGHPGLHHPGLRHSRLRRSSKDAGVTLIDRDERRSIAVLRSREREHWRVGWVMPFLILSLGFFVAIVVRWLLREIGWSRRDPALGPAGGLASRLSGP